MFYLFGHPLGKAERQGSRQHFEKELGTGKLLAVNVDVNKVLAGDGYLPGLAEEDPFPARLAANVVSFAIVGDEQQDQGYLHRSRAGGFIGDDIAGDKADNNERGEEDHGNDADDSPTQSA